MSLTASSFREIAQPLLFRRLRLETGLDTCRARIEGIRLLLDTRPEAERWTKDLLLIGRPRDSERVDVDKIPATLEAVFVRMRSITSVELLFFTFSKTMVDHILSCRMRSLKTYEADVPDDEDVARKLQTASIPLKDLRVRGYHHPSRVQSPPPSWVGLLFVPSLSSLQLLYGAATLAYHLHQHNHTHIFQSLRTLTIEAPNWRDVASFIALTLACPELQKLTVYQEESSGGAEPEDETDDETSPHYVLLTEALSNVSSFSGPLHHARIIIPGRPVSRIHIKFRLNENLSEDNCAHLAQSSVQVSKIGLSGLDWRSRYTDLLRKHFPALRELEVRVQRTLQMVSSSLVLDLAKSV